MSKKNKPLSGSKESTSWLKPWTKGKEKPDKTNHPPNKEVKPYSEEKINPTQNPFKDSFPSLSTPSDLSPDKKLKPRSLGKQQIADQPLNPVIKKTLELMIDTLTKDKGSSSVPLRKNPIFQPEAEQEVKSPPPEEPTPLPIEEAPPSPEDLDRQTSHEDSHPLSTNSISLEEISESPEVISESLEVISGSPEVISESLEEVLDPLETISYAPEQDSNSAVENFDLTFLEVPVPSLPPISDTLKNIRHIKIWSLESENVNPKEKSTEELFSEAVTLYQLGLGGEKEAVPQAFKLLIHLLQIDRQNLLAEAYLGSVISLMGRDAQNLNDRFKFAVKGLQILDKVVSSDPENVEIRGLRAFVCARLPEQFFHRGDTAIEDFTYLVSRYDEDESLFPMEFYFQLLYELALVYHRLDKNQEAVSTCRKLLSLTTDPKYKKLIEQEGILSSDLPRWKKSSERKLGLKNDWAKHMYEEKLEEGIHLHYRAIADDQYALVKAYDIFKQAYKRDPHDSLIKAYYADCLSRLGLSSSDTQAMFRHASHAIKLLDQAVNSRPEDINIRLIRGYNSYHIPEAFFRRTFTAIHDFKYILEHYENDPTLLPEETYWQVLYDLGDAYERLEMSEEAHSVWHKLSQCGDTPYKAAVDELLRENPPSLLTSDSEQNSEELLREGIRLHDLAAKGNRRASLRAYEVLRKAHEADITNPLAQGYLGSSMAILGQTKTDPTEVYHYFFRGMNHINKAIASDPQNYFLHLLLAKVMYQYSPSFFRGNEKVVKELKLLKLAYERDNRVFQEEEYLQILHDLGACYQRAGDTEKAKKCWEKLSKLTINPKYNLLLEDEQEGATDMDKDKIRDKFKEIAIDIAQEKAKEREKEKGRRKERRHSNETAPSQGTDEQLEKKRRPRKKDAKNPSVPIPETTPRKRKKDRRKEALTVTTTTPERVKLSPEEKKARREEKAKARAERLEKAMSRAKRTKNE